MYLYVEGDQVCWNPEGPAANPITGEPFAYYASTYGRGPFTVVDVDSATPSDGDQGEQYEPAHPNLVAIEHGGANKFFCGSFFVKVLSSATA